MWGKCGEYSLQFPPISDHDDGGAIEADKVEQETTIRPVKKIKVEKDPILPTRRSGRIKEKKREAASDCEGSDSEIEGSPGNKRRCSAGGDGDNQVVPVAPTSTTQVKISSLIFLFRHLPLYPPKGCI